MTMSGPREPLARRKSVAVLQSNYLPWKGYFDLIGRVDVFVFYDDVQYTSGDWRNRNRIKTLRGTQWLTVPVVRDFGQRICDARIQGDDWPKDHRRRLDESLGAAPFYARLTPLLDEIYRPRRWSHLVEVNRFAIRWLAQEVLGLATEFVDSRSLEPEGTREDRLLDVLSKVGATDYWSGPAAASYIDERRFAEARVEVHWMDYSTYPEYPQAFPPFEHQVTFLDLVAQTGPDVRRYLWPSGMPGRETS